MHSAAASMRNAVLVVFVASLGCGSSSAPAVPDANHPYASTTCPSTFSEGEPCTLSADVLCFSMNTFSSCSSAWYRCQAGTFTVDHYINAQPGMSCTDSPISTCTSEGNTDCSTPPTAGSCTCEDDGLWSCECACPGGQYCQVGS